VRRARLWVGSFKVVKQASRGGTLSLTVDVRIDAGKIRDRLGELGVPVIAGAGAAEVVPAGAEVATLLLRVNTVEGPYASFGGRRDDATPGAGDAAHALRSRKLRVVDAPATGDVVRAGDGLPISDDAARGYGADAGARIVVVANVDMGAPGQVRGARGVAAFARAQVRVVDVVTGIAIGEARSARGAAGDSASQVTASATRLALVDAVMAASAPLAAKAASGRALDLPAARTGEVLVRLRGATGTQVSAVRGHLASAEGIKSVKLRRIAGGEVVLAVKGVKADRAAALLRGVAEVGSRARVSEGAVEAVLGAP
jgi:hypothetical protein